MWYFIAEIFVILSIMLSLSYKRNKEEVVRKAQIISTIIAACSFFFTVTSKEGDDIYQWQEKIFTKYLYLQFI